ncbi:MAG: SRPBCC domain-containing protein [Cryomorphaceae bacterium]|nr:SRPBCC domain-containing protein [Cryomorphaceae bacterium]
MEAIEQVNYINASPSLVYTALTTQTGLRQIWTPNAVVKPEVGFVNVFDFGEGYLTKMKVVELEEDKCIEWECVDSDEEWLGTEVSFELTYKQGKTAIALRHFNWKARTEYFQWCAYNWALFLKRLKDHCETQ